VAGPCLVMLWFSTAPWTSASFWFNKLMVSTASLTARLIMPSMEQCQTCRNLRRIRRTLWDWFTCRAVYDCRDCTRRIRVPRLWTFRFSNKARCPCCGNWKLRRLAHQDKIETMSWHPFSVIQGVLGGRLYRCLPLAILRLAQEELFAWRNTISR
jgi:hypothetical protein